MILMVLRDDHDDVAMPGVPMSFIYNAAAQQKCRGQRYQDHKFLVHS